MRLASLSALALGGLLALASAASAQIVQINSNVAVNTSWGPTGTVVGSVFWVRNNISINAGVTLNIQPGVVVKFDSNRSLMVVGNLKAIGTAPGNIYFTSSKDDAVGGDTNGDGNATAPAASDWTGIVFPDASPDFGSRLDYCDVRYAGYGSGGALTFTSASDTVSNSVVRRSYFGVDCAGTAAPALINTTIEASTATPIVLDFTATPVFSSLVFSSSNNGYDAFGLRGNTLTTGTVATLPRRGATVGNNPQSNVTYVLLGSLTINAGASLTIDPGVVIKPSGGHTITVGGNLIMNGGAAVGDTITITSIHDDNFGSPGDTDNNGSIAAPARGDWSRVTFLQGSTGSLSRCRLKFGSNNVSQGMVEMTNTAIPVSNSLLTDAAHGLAVFGVSTAAISTVQIQNCSSTPVLLSVSASPVFTGIDFLANAITAVGLEGENVAVDSRIPVRTLGGYANITYYLMNGTLVMQSPAILRIDPGVVIKNQISGGGLQIDGGLIADAKPESLIVFTSERDDLYGNPADTNGDGAITTPAQGNWSYIKFTATANDAVSKLDNCRITYGSSGPFDGWSTSLWIVNAAPAVTNCVINKGSYGIRLDGDSTPLIDGCSFTNMQYAPIVMSVASNPTITAANTYLSNGYNALALLSETLSQNARLRYRSGVGTPTFAYLPTGTITIASGVTLAIDPQVVIKPSSTFTVFQVNGALNVVGSDAGSGRVVFTSRRDDTPAYGGDTTPNDAVAPQAGDWGNLSFSDTAVDAACVLRNALFTFGGSGAADGGVITTTSASPRLVKLEFFHNVTAMTFAGNSQPVVDSSSVLNCTQLPIVVSLISDPQFPHPSLITLANNTFTCLGILGETIAQDVRTRVRAIGTFSNIAYCPSSAITIAFGAKWTIAPGIVMKFGRSNIDPIATQMTIAGALVADGKPESLIVFTSTADDAFGGDVRSDGALTQPAAGQWNFIQFDAISNDAVSVLDNVRIRYAGYSNIGALRFISAAPPVTNSFITATSGYGVYIDGDAAPSFTNVNVDSSTNVPVYMSLVSKPAFTNVQFLGNTYTALGVLTETLAQDLRWPIRAVSGRNNMPYLVQGALTVGLNSVLTMQPGVIVKFTSNGSILVQRGMIAEGRTVEPESLVVFTSYRDDFYGGDTDNAATAPAASDWNYITVDGTAIDAQVRFRNCVFRYGGSGSTTGVLRCVNSSPTVDSTLFAANSVGISVEGASNPVVHGSSFFGNTQFAINNTGNSFCVDAQGNWWGAANGPNDATATGDLCLLTTNAGSGDKVSNNVDYQPWATSGVLNPLLGDVSLNGQVLAYDASLVLQHLVALVTLSPLQLSVADVSGTAGVTAFDASLILQYVAGVIPAFPAVNNLNQGPPEAIAAARAWTARAQGSATVTLGAARRDGADWVVPVRATADAPMYSLELRLAGGAAGRLAAIEIRDAGALTARTTEDGGARIAIAALAPLAEGEVALLRFTGGESFEVPALAWARVNESEAAGAVPSGPVLSFLAPPAPNPARGRASLRLVIGTRDAGATASVRVLDVTGRSVRTLVSGPLGVGAHDLAWDLADESGRPVAAGLYFIRADAGPIHATHRLTVVR